MSPRLEKLLKLERRILRRIYGNMGNMDQVRLNKRVFEYKSGRGYVKQMREETEKLKMTDKNCPDREQYGK